MVDDNMGIPAAVRFVILLSFLNRGPGHHMSTSFTPSTSNNITDQLSRAALKHFLHALIGRSCPFKRPPGTSLKVCLVKRSSAAGHDAQVLIRESPGRLSQVNRTNIGTALFLHFRSPTSPAQQASPQTHYPRPVPFPSPASALRP